MISNSKNYLLNINKYTRNKYKIKYIYDHYLLIYLKIIMIIYFECLIYYLSSVLMWFYIYKSLTLILLIINSLKRLKELNLYLILKIIVLNWKV